MPKTPSKRQRAGSGKAARQEEDDMPMPDASPSSGVDETARSPSLGNSPPFRAELRRPDYIKTPTGSDSSSDSSSSSFVSQPSPTPAPSTRRTNPAARSRGPRQGPPRLSDTHRLNFHTPSGGFASTATLGNTPAGLLPPRNAGSVYGSGSAVRSLLRASVASTASLSSPQTPPQSQTPADEIPERRRTSRVMPSRNRRLSPTNPAHRRASDLFGSNVGTPRDSSEPLGWTPPSMKGPKGKGEVDGSSKDKDEGKGKGEDKDKGEEMNDDGKGKREDREK
ncbi:hypothetical protein F5Y05DRAFT_418841 [Hypoxylon sp. FL0543]|nr:hypothetical protein F5Y05DRAFT_418841 [Hypoxylon sp. FL0543]